METLKIAFISDKSAPIYFGGYEIRVLELANRLAERGHEVNVYTTSPRNFSTQSGANFYGSFPIHFQNDKSGKRSIAHSVLFSMAASRNPMQGWEPDFTIIEAIPYLHLLSMKRWIKKGTSKIILDVPEAWYNYSYFGQSFNRFSNISIGGLLRVGISYADVITAISKATAESLVRNYSVDKTKISVVPCGVDIEYILELSELKSIRSSLVHEYDFITIGRLVEIKRHSDFIDALGILKRKHGWNGKAAIIGAGPLRDELIMKAASLGIKENVDFLGFVSEEQKAKLLASSKIFVLTSEREGFSIATLEAMALGLPVVVAKPEHSEVFGPSDFVTENYNGLLYPVGDVSKLSATLNKLLGAESEISFLSKNAMTTASRYDWREVAQNLEVNLFNL